MSHLKLSLLGTPEVRHNTQLITFPTRKALALLIYLAVEGGTLSREGMTALLWPESDAELGRTSLRKALAYLRKALDESSNLTNQPHLITDRDSLYLDPASSVEVDVGALRAAAQAVRQPPLASASAMAALPSAQVRRLLEPLQQAVSLYRGDFLAGFSLNDAPEFDDWASLQREFWHRQAVLVFDRLSQAQFESGELAGAIDTTTRWVAHDSLDEAAYRRLMQLHFANGDRAAALQTYAACQNILARELNVEPSPETEALAKRLRAPNFRFSISDFGLGVSHPKSKIQNPKSAEWPLVGRAFEHMQLVNAYHAAEQNGLQVITLEGEPGIGKTKLAHEFLAWASAQNANTLQSRAFEAGGRLPYQPIVEALRPALSRDENVSSAPLLFRSLSPTWLAELSRLLPELADQAPDLPPPLVVNEAEARLRLFEAITRLGQVLAESTAVVLFIDDLQWADAASLEVLQYVARRWVAARLPMLLLFAMRAEDVAASPAMTDWLNALRRDAPVTRLTLSMLTLEDTRQLMQTLVRPESAKPPYRTGDERPEIEISTLRSLEQFSQRLFAETKGQPFFIVQTLRLLMERGLWQPNESGEWQVELGSEVPSSVRDLIQSRLARLSPAAQTCCVGGAVLGDGFEFGPLGRVAGLSEKEALPALEELLARGLLREAQPTAETLGPPLYFFTHDRIREVAYAQLSEARRRVLHREALEALSAEAQRGLALAPPAQLARHALLAGLPILAFQYSLAAGEAAMNIFAINDAINHLSQAQRLWQTGDLEHEAELQKQVFNMYQRLGRAYELSSQLDEASDVYRDMLMLARRQREPGMECIALNHLATSLAQTYRVDLDQPLALLQEALQVAETSGDLVAQAETEWNVAQHYFYRAKAGTALPHAERALALAREIGRKELIARALNILAYLKAQWFQWAESAACAEETKALYAELGDRAMLTDSLCLVAQARLSLGQPTAAIDAARAGLVIAEEIENPWGKVNGAFHLALSMAENGDYTAALAYAQQAVALARTLNLNALLCIVHLVLGRVYAALGNLEAARRAYLEAEEFSNAMTARPFSAPVAVALCADCTLTNEWAEAYAWAAKFLEVRDASLDFHAGLVFWPIVEALLQAGETDRAREEVQRFEGLAGDNPRYQIPHLRSLALLAEWDDNSALAITYLEEASGLTEEIGLPGEQWPIQIKLAELYQAVGDKVWAQWAMRRAAEIVQALAAKIDDEGLRAGFLARALKGLGDYA